MSEQTRDERSAGKPAEESEAIAGKSGDVGAIQIGDGAFAAPTPRTFEEHFDEPGVFASRAAETPRAQSGEDEPMRDDPTRAAPAQGAEPEPASAPKTAAPSVSDERAERMRQMTERALRIKANREEELRRRAEEAERLEQEQAEARRLEEERLAEERRVEETRLAEERRLESERREMERMERDAFVEQNSIGSLLFGARATMGKHDLKAVERDLRIKARYLQAIEQVDPEALPSGAYLSGYVRAYAAYLQPHLPMAPDEALRKFERELSLKTGHAPESDEEPAAEPAEPQRSVSKSAAASAAAYAAAKAGAAKLRASEAEAAALRARPEPVVERKISPAERLAERAAAAKAQAQAQTRMAAASRAPIRKAPQRRYGAVAALGVLGLGLVGFSLGAWSLWGSSQQVSAPAAQSVTVYDVIERRDTSLASASVKRPSIEAYTGSGVMTKIYEPPAGAAASDGPVSRIDPDTVGAYADSVKPPIAADVEAPETAAAEPAVAPEPAYWGPAFAIRAVAEAWVQVKTGEGDVVFLGTLAPGEMAALPVDRGALELRTGNGGGVVIVVEGAAYGPIDRPGVVRTVALTPAPPEGLYPERPELTATIAEEAREEARQAALEEARAAALTAPALDEDPLGAKALGEKALIEKALEQKARSDETLSDEGGEPGAPGAAASDPLAALGEDVGPTEAEIEAAAAGSGGVEPAAGEAETAGDGDYLEIFGVTGEEPFVTDPAALEGSIASSPAFPPRGDAEEAALDDQAEAAQPAPVQLDAARGGSGR